jgi:hypothetical protein
MAIRLLHHHHWRTWRARRPRPHAATGADRHTKSCLAAVAGGGCRMCWGRAPLVIGTSITTVDTVITTAAAHRDKTTFLVVAVCSTSELGARKCGESTY